MDLSIEPPALTDSKKTPPKSEARATAQTHTKTWTPAAWLPVAVGLCALYGPTLQSLAFGIWGNGEQSHGPIVLAIACWLIYRRWSEMLTAATADGGHRSGWVPLVIGLLLYALGRSQEILLFEVGSLIWVLSGLAILHFGYAGLKAHYFALFFMIFMVPLPMQLVDLVTMPMKIAVSYVAENALYHLG